MVLPIAADITRPEDVVRMIAITIERFGQLDVLVNNAGSSARGDLLNTSTDEFRKLMELNFFALVECTRAALPALIKSRGHIVNIGSLSSFVGLHEVAAYGASKSGVRSLTQSFSNSVTTFKRSPYFPLSFG